MGIEEIPRAPDGTFIFSQVQSDALQAEGLEWERDYRQFAEELAASIGHAIHPAHSLRLGLSDGELNTDNAQYTTGDIHFVAGTKAAARNQAKTKAGHNATWGQNTPRA